MSAGAREPRAERSKLPPVMNTGRAFVRLLPVLGIDTVCDIGSKDGADALRFRQRLPAAEVIAFEANPRNYAGMRADPALGAARIRIEPLAVCEHDGEADFFVVRAAPHGDHARRGMSSLYRRRETDELECVVRVGATRLDSWLGTRGHGGHLALWIDVEGKAFEVIEGAQAVLSQVRLLHVEVETAPLIAAGQKTYTDIRARLAARGFVELATDFPATGRQFNSLWINAALPAAMRRAVARRLVQARWRRRLSNLVYHLLPGRVRGYLAGRFGIRGSIA